MAAKPKKSPAASPRRGWLRRLVRFSVYFLGLLTLLGVIDFFVTSHSVKGMWQFHAPELTENTVETMMDRAPRRGPERLEGRGPRRLGDAARSVLTQFGNKLLGAVASQVEVEVVDSGYRMDSVVGARAASAFMRMAGGDPQASINGCLSGTYLAAFPLVRVSCGDGSGRTLWFLMKTWPSQEMRLFPLPFGNQQLKDRARKMVGEGPDRTKLEAANELLTLRFTRQGSP